MTELNSGFNKEMSSATALKLEAEVAGILEHHLRLLGIQPLERPFCGVEVVIQHEVEIFTCLWRPVQAAVNAQNIG